MCSLVSDTAAVEKDGISNNFYIKGTASQIPPVEVKYLKYTTCSKKNFLIRISVFGIIVKIQTILSFYTASNNL